ncbi:hypothetical protein GCM10017044_12140 [Kordiimonas sediminis]|uniref:Uncharacterized protein n=1 Tax=Kordiimonas sediminis TaxID=1735581 RepID=A0A919ARZ4_9PROT|nr:hypothetical protein [Kordiimonas sediminis]GHF19157.1 hypothetical protein GCM10017044_12140 [Kordiimonas sediminis]
MTNLFPWTLETAGTLTVVTAALLIVALMLTLPKVRRRLAGSPVRLVGVTLLNLLAAGALFLLGLDIRTSDQSPQNIILLTDPSTPAPAQTGSQVFTLVETGTQKDTIRLHDIGQLALKVPAIDTLTLVGNGLDAPELNTLPPVQNLEWQPPQISGFADMRWQRSLTVGEPLQIYGRYITGGDTDKILRIKLLDPAGDEIGTVNTKSDAPFILSAVPRAEGHLAYQLVATERDGTVLHTENLYLFVTAVNPARILVVQSAPSYETQHLKNWAKEFGAKMLIQSQISKDRFLTQTVNFPDAPTNTIFTSDTLRNFDLMIIDGRFYAGMDSEQRNTLEMAVTGGLGLFILADRELIAAVQAGDIRVGAVAIEGQDPAPETVTPVWPGITSDIPLPVLAVALKGNSASPLLQSTDGKVLSVSTPQGLGKIAVSILRERYILATSGERSAYAAYWAHILRSLGRADAAVRIVPEPSDQIALVDRANRLCALTADSGIKFQIRTVRQDTEETVQANQDSLGAPLWCAVHYARESGWHRVTAETADGEKAESAFYVYAANDFSAQAQYSRQQATKRYQERLLNGGQPETSAFTQRTPIDKTWLWISFIILASLLWIERKIPLRAPKP